MNGGTIVKLLSVLLMLAATFTVAAPAASAQDAPAAAKETKKKEPAKKKSAKAAAPVDEEDKEPDVSSSSSTDFNCDLGSKLTIYRNAEDNEHIALRWNKKLLRLKRVVTTTGANRFENGKNGWVWIDIPTKGMLLDSKKGRQLANECKSHEHTTNS
jgi:membrane-bound inhibitor of C-type lysozyme